MTVEIPQHDGLNDGPRLHIMSVDVEDYFQVEAFADSIPRASWEQWPSRVATLLTRYRFTAFQDLTKLNLKNPSRSHCQAQTDRS